MFLEPSLRTDAGIGLEDQPTRDPGAGADVVIEAGGGDRVLLPGDDALLKGEFLRDGEDLLIEATDGGVTRIEGFFAGETPPDLVIGGAVVPGRFVLRLAHEAGEGEAAGGDDMLIGGNEEDLLGAAGDSAESQQAALPEPTGEAQSVAEITEIEGQVIVLRADGSRVTAEVGTPLFEDDVITTGEGGSVGISFVDGMSFSLGEQARLLLDEFRYDPGSHDGGGLLSVLQGQFSFVSGAAAHTAEDALMIETPTMTIGVRGTKVVAQAAAEGQVSRIALLAEEDGTVGKIMVTTDQGSQLISEANMMVEVVSRFEAPSSQVPLSSDQVFDFFNSALGLLPAPAAFFDSERPEGLGLEQDEGSPARVAQNDRDGTIGSREAGQPVVDAGLETASTNETTTLVNPLFQPQAESSIGGSGTSFGPGILEGLTATTAAPDSTEPTESELPPPADETSQAGDLPASNDAGAETGGPVGPAPSVVAPLSNQATAEDGGFLLDTSSAFADPGDTLTFSAKLVGGAPLPAWLSINPTTGILSGTPANGDVGLIDVEVTATDSAAQSVVDTFQLTVTNTNDAPTAAVIANTPATEDAAFAYDVSGSFTDVDVPYGDTLTFSAKLLGGAPLPGWLSIDASTGILSGTPGNGDVGAINVEVTATDGSGASASSSFQLSVANTNDAPTVAVIGNALAIEDMAFAHDVSTAFTDVDVPHGDTLTFSAKLVGGAPLPGWLSIDASTGILSGTPGNGDVGFTDVEVTATDGAGASVSSSFTLSVANTNDAPTVVSIIADIQPTQGVALNHDISGHFADLDTIHGDSLSFSAKLVGGAPLPGWLSIDSVTGVLSGTPGVPDIGSSVDVEVTATDLSSASVSTSFNVAVDATNVAPVLSVTGSPTLTAIAEDTAGPAGNTVAEIVIDGSITDGDGAVEAIAITGIDNSNGTWQFAAAGGSTFNNIGAVSDNSALLLSGLAKVRFVPNADFNGTATFTYRAWDQSVGSSEQMGVDVSVNGGTTAFSAATETASITVTAVNDAPVLDNAGSPSLATIAEDTAAPTGTTVSEIVVNGSITDVDGAVPEAIAVTSVDDANGTWEYSTDGGANFSAIGAVSESSALLLGPAALVRFVPAADFNGTATFTYKAWDQSSGANGDSGVDTTVGTAFSTASEVASITVTPQNGAPVAAGAGMLDFSGTNSFVDIGDPGASNNDLDLMTRDLTVEAWFYYDGSTSGGQQMIVSKYNQTASKEGYSIFLKNGELVVQVNSTGGNADSDTAASSIDLAGNEGWYHVAMVIDQAAGADASSVTGYLNGSSVGWTAGYSGTVNDTFTMDGAGTNTDKSFMIGAVDNGPGETKYFDAQIADVRVWDKARSQSEIQADLSRTLTGDETNLIGNWHLDEGTGTTAGNAVSGGADGAISGGPSWQGTTSFSIAMDEELQGRVTATDPDGDTLSFSVSTSASNGTADIDAATGAWEYTPNVGYTGADSFSYQVSDGNGGTETVNISVTVA